MTRIFFLGEPLTLVSKEVRDFPRRIINNKNNCRLFKATILAMRTYEKRYFGCYLIYISQFTFHLTQGNSLPRKENASEP